VCARGLDCDGVGDIMCGWLWDRGGDRVSPGEMSPVMVGGDYCSSFPWKVPPSPDVCLA
jgi:hypothetical protein